MYYPLTKENIAVKIIGLDYKPATDKVEVTLFRNFMCPVEAYMYHMMRKFAERF